MKVNSVIPRFLDDSKDDMKSSSTYLKRHFTYFAVVASLNHALAYVVLAYSSSLLNASLASIILSITWLLNAVSGFTWATFITKYLGYKTAMIISLAGYTLQIYCLYIAVLYPSIAWPVAIGGSVISGLTSAVWWTAQGVCFELTCQKLSDLDHDMNMTLSGKLIILSIHPITNINVIRADLSAIWTLIYQVADIVVFLILSILPLYFGMSFTDTLLCLVVIGVITSILGFFFDNLGDQGTSMTRQEVVRSMWSVPRQLHTDARATLLTPFVFGFAITTAMFAYFINGAIENTQPTIGLNRMGILESYSYFIAVVVAFPYAYICTHYQQGSNFVMQFGSFCFMLCGVVVLLLNTEAIATWKWLLILRTLYGMGRSVFEGACRAVYANLFHGDELPTAYSIQTLMTGLSGGICFYLFNTLSQTSIAIITIINGICALSAYFVLMSLEKIDQPITWSELLCACQKKKFSGSTSPYSPLIHNNSNNIPSSSSSSSATIATQHSSSSSSTTNNNNNNNGGNDQRWYS